MLRLDVLHDQWLMLALGGGVVFVLMFALYYQIMGTTRAEQRARAQAPITGPRSFARWLLTAIPWILLVTLLAITAWALSMPILKAIHPPNW